MHDMNWFAIIIIGVLAGWIASMVVNRHHGIIVNLLIGLLGSVIGGWLAGKLHIPLGGFWRDLAASAGGAVLLLALLSLMRPRRL